MMTAPHEARSTRSRLNANQVCFAFLFDVLIWVALSIPVWINTDGGNAGVWLVDPVCNNLYAIANTSDGLRLNKVPESFSSSEYCNLIPDHVCAYVLKNQSAVDATESMLKDSPEEIPESLFVQYPPVMSPADQTQFCDTNFRNGIIAMLFFAGIAGMATFILGAAYLYSDKPIKYRWVVVTVLAAYLAGLLGMATMIWWSVAMEGQNASFTFLIIGWVLAVLVAITMTVTCLLPGLLSIELQSTHGSGFQFWRPPRMNVYADESLVTDDGKGGATPVALGEDLSGENYVGWQTARAADGEPKRDNRRNLSLMDRRSFGRKLMRRAWGQHDNDSEERSLEDAEEPAQGREQRGGGGGGGGGEGGDGRSAGRRRGKKSKKPGDSRSSGMDPEEEEEEEEEEQQGGEEERERVRARDRERTDHGKSRFRRKGGLTESEDEEDYGPGQDTPEGRSFVARPTADTSFAADMPGVPDEQGMRLWQSQRGRGSLDVDKDFVRPM